MPLQVAAKANEIFVAGIGNVIDMIGVIFLRWNDIGIVPSFSSADFGTITHGWIESLLFQNIPFFRAQQGRWLSCRFLPPRKFIQF